MFPLLESCPAKAELNLEQEPVSNKKHDAMDKHLSPILVSRSSLQRACTLECDMLSSN